MRKTVKTSKKLRFVDWTLVVIVFLASLTLYTRTLAPGILLVIALSFRSWLTS
jgi:hypothetical protein